MYVALQKGSEKVPVGALSCKCALGSMKYMIMVWPCGFIICLSFCPVLLPSI